MNPKLKKRGVLIIVVLVVLEAAYVIGANYLLSTEWLKEKINRRPDKLQIEWSGIRTTLPGWVRVEDLRMRGQSKKLQWYVAMDRTNAWVGLLPLAVKKVNIHRVSGSGLDFRLRKKPEPGAAAAPGAPPIPDLIAETPSEPHRKHRRTWTIQVNNFDLQQLKQLWALDYRVTGDGEIHCEMLRFKIRGPLSARSIDVSLPSAEIKLGAEAATETADLHVEDLDLDSFIPKEVKGAKVLEVISGRVKLKSRVPDLDFLDFYFKKADWLKLAGAGTVDADIYLEGGQLLEPSKIHVESEGIDVTYLDWQGNGAGVVNGTVSGRGKDATSEMTVKLTDIDIKRSDEEEPYIEAPSFEIVGKATDLDIANGFADLAVDLTLAQASVPALASYNSLLPADAGFAIASGSGSINGKLAVSGGIATGNFEVAGKGISATFKGAPMSGDLTVTTVLKDGDLETRKFDLSGSSLTLDNVTAGDAGVTPEPPWKGSVTLTSGTVRWTKPLAIDSQLRLALTDTEPILAIFAADKKILKHFEKMLEVKDISGTAELDLGEGGVTLRNVDITGDKLELLAQLQLGGGGEEGLLYAKFHGFAAGVELEDGKHHLKLIHPKKWYEEQVPATSGGP